MSSFASLKKAFAALSCGSISTTATAGMTAPKLVAQLLAEWNSIFHTSLSTNRPSIPEQDRKIISLMRPKLNSIGINVHATTSSSAGTTIDNEGTFSYVEEWDKAYGVLEMASKICVSADIVSVGGGGGAVAVADTSIRLLGDALIQKLIETCNDKLMDLLIDRCIENCKLKESLPFLSSLHQSIEGDYVLMNDVISSLYLATGRWDRILELLAIGNERISEVVYLECFQVVGGGGGGAFDYGKVEKFILEGMSKHPTLCPMPKNAVKALECMFGVRKEGGIESNRLSTPSTVPESLIRSLKKYNKKICQE